MPTSRSAAPIVYCFIAIFVSLFMPGSGQAQEKVKVEIRVTVPKETPADSTIYIAGDQPAVGQWKADGAALKPAGDHVYSIQLELPKGGTMEYKIDRGSWETVEKDAKGDEVGNRTLSLDGDKTENITVATWAGATAAGGADKPAVPAAPAAPKASGVVGDVRYHQSFHSDILHNDRRIIVWLPPTYSTDTSARFPVLYLHDGQNCFDASTSYAGEWRADETADALIRANKMKPIIMVAVANAGPDRMNEYTPTRDAVRNAGGRGEQYAQFLITEVKPFIDRTYRTQADRENTAAAGSSLGGLISLYLAYKHGDIFGAAGVISPSLSWDNASLMKQIEADPSPLKAERIWLDMGGDEGNPTEAAQGVANAKSLAATLQGTIGEKNLKYLEVPGAKHNEAAWAARFDQVLVFLFGT
ncbi:MAG TPA: alpha/beta hydrolase-fold protein [Tepidisphaeraceae bacterium]|nr:alpha/beta hydrolase-fold protein [Tepidisphaeraceae bacterium]